MEPNVCLHCGISDNEKTLVKCPMCHRFACDEHGARRGGKFFCHVGCADAFFFPDEDEEGVDEA